MATEAIFTVVIMIFGYAAYSAIANWRRDKKMQEERLKYYKARPNNSKKK